MSTILDNIERRLEELEGNPVLIGLNVAAAIAAMRKGMKTDEWEFIMRPYATDENGNLNADQLARLMGTDGTLGDSILDRKRCYIIGNCLCGDTTLPTTGYGVDSIEDTVGNHRCDRFDSPCLTTKTSKKRPPAKKAGKKAGRKR